MLLMLMQHKVLLPLCHLITSLRPPRPRLLLILPLHLLPPLPDLPPVRHLPVLLRRLLPVSRLLAPLQPALPRFLLNQLSCKSLMTPILLLLLLLLLLLRPQPKRL